MLEILNISPELIRGLSTGVAGALISGVAVHLIERAKHRRLKRDNARLVQETEEIKSNYNKQLEELKRDHQLEISRRKYQYEGKKDSYVAFFKMIDTFSADQNIKSQEKLREYIHEFNRNFGDTQSSQKKATVVFSKKIQAITMESYKEFIRLKQETNVIKLMASEDVVNHLKLMELGYENLMKDSDKLMSAMPVLVMSQNEEKMNAMKHDVEIKGKAINQIKDELNSLMRKELNEI